MRIDEGGRSRRDRGRPYSRASAWLGGAAAPRPCRSRPSTAHRRNPISATSRGRSWRTRATVSNTRPNFSPVPRHRRLGPRAAAGRRCAGATASSTCASPPTSIRATCERALDGAEPASTLFIVASKTFTTQETMANAGARPSDGARKPFHRGHRQRRGRQGASARAEILPMWDWVGGRFSVWSAVGFAAACAMGFDRIRGIPRRRRATWTSISPRPRWRRTCRR